MKIIFENSEMTSTSTVINKPIAQEVNHIGKQIVDSAIKIHKELGPGLLESAYQEVITYELRLRGLSVECEVPLPIVYFGVNIQVGYRIDMLINSVVIIENKTVDQILPIHKAQLLTYLKLSGNRLGFLLNWNVTLMKYGITRMVL
jgi:GxxExxY protein